PTQGQTLNASVADADGASGAIDYQWYRDGVAIAGATGAGYTTAQADVGKAITVAASFTDDLGGVETPTSAATDNVADVNDAPLFGSFADVLATTDEDGEAQITFATMLALGDEADIDGNVVGFAVRSLAGGSLRIGADAATAAAWHPLTNALIDSANHAYWRPDANVNGIQDAFVVVAVDDDGGISSGSASGQVLVNPLNDTPLIQRNRIALTAGDSVVLDSSMLSASDIDDVDATLAFSVDQVVGGYFALAADPTSVVTAFTQAQIDARAIIFVDDGDTQAPQIRLSVSDGSASSSSATRIDFDDGTVTDLIAIGPPATPPPSPSAPTAEPDTGESDSGTEPIPDETDEEVSAEEDVEESRGEETETESIDDSLAQDSDESSPWTDDDLYPGSSDRASDNGADIASMLRQGAMLKPSLAQVPEELAAPQAAEVPKLLASEIQSILSAPSFLNDLDRLRQNSGDLSDLEQQRVASSIAVSTGLSVGYVAWLIRSGALLSTALSSLPAWHFIDPLPVLGSVAERRSGNAEGPGEDDEDEIETMFKERSTSADSVEKQEQTEKKDSPAERLSQR
ncbi:MAG: hypothetical protein KDI68_08220, partial [Gammaproteobacteria bacterium]|nr:hypothetical protein [Gammaproteobacteria bacterium]